MKRTLPLAAAAALLALSACSKPQPEVVDTNPDPMAAELANRPKVELPPAIKADKTFRCKDNSLALVTFFEGAKQANVRLKDGDTATVLRAPEAGQPYVAEGGWKLTGDESAISLESPGKPLRTCHL